jgi:hypothetical protein
MKHTERYRTLAVLWSLGLASCAAQPAARSAVETSGVLPADPTSPTPGSSSPATASVEQAEAQDKSRPDDKALLSLLPSTKLELAEGIARAEQHGARAVSAKFEVADGHLSLSVYTAQKGLELDAEHNVLAELSGDPTGADWQPQEEIFTDTKHLTRASYHLTLVQRARLSLGEVIAKAMSKQSGRVYSVEPAIHEHSPIFHVRIATPSGEAVNIDIESGA